LFEINTALTIPHYAALESAQIVVCTLHIYTTVCSQIHIAVVKQTRNFVLLPYWIDSSVERNDVSACHLWS